MIRKWLKFLIPSIVMKIIRYDYKYGWHGDYKDWADALAKSNGYQQDDILDKIKAAALKVKNGEAAFERDSIAYKEIPCSLPVIAALRWAAGLRQQQLHVIDMGGSLGTGYRQNMYFLNDITSVSWNIIEQPHFVDCGKLYFKNNELNFFYSLEECMKEKTPGIAMFSTSLQYFEKPYSLLQEIMNYSFDFILIDRIGLSTSKKDRLTVQHVHPRYYNASYPCWFLTKEKIIKTLSSNYKLVSEYLSDETYPLGLDDFTYTGFLFKKI